MKLFLTFILAFVTAATLSQFIRLARWPFRLAFWVTLAVVMYLAWG